MLSKAFYFKMRVRGSSKFQTHSLQSAKLAVPDVHCLQWVPPCYHVVKPEALGSEH